MDWRGQPSTDSIGSVEPARKGRYPSGTKSHSLQCGTYRTESLTSSHRNARPQGAGAPKEQLLDLEKLVADLAKERDRLGRAINALLGSASAALSGGRKKKRAGRPKG